MASLQASDIADLITTTQKDLGRMKWTDISYSLQEHVALPMILQKEKVSYQSGNSLQWNVQTGTSGAAKDTGLYAVDNVNVSDVMQTATAPWRHMTTNYAIERREIAMNRTPAQIVDLVKVRRHDAMSSLATHMEQRFWNQPSTTQSDRLYGIPYWVTYGSGSASGDFVGGDPTYTAEGTGAGGLASSTYSNWQNWVSTYASVSSDDLVRRWRKAATFTNFKPPSPHPDYMGGPGNYGFYTNYNVIGPLEEILEAQNENLGNDVASKDGQLLFRRTPVMWVPQLENATGNPVYGINWASLRPAFLAGEYLREEGPAKASNQHTVFLTHVDMTMNLICYNRRANFLLATGSDVT